MEGISTPQGQASSSSYALVLFGLGLVLGILTIRARYQQKLEERDAGGGEMVVTSDFQRFQGKFMSEFRTHTCTTKLLLFVYVLRWCSVIVRAPVSAFNCVAVTYEM